jgi:pimeloyl-ACP methyl ester carboxylesterase
MTCRRLCQLLSVLAICTFCTTFVLSPIARAVGAPAAADKDADAEKIPAEEEIELTTRDGVKIVATYWPPAKTEGKEGQGPAADKDRVPVILLHAWKGSRANFLSIGPTLQKLGHAVIAPDLRGHGDSKEMVDASGEKKKLDATSLRPADFAAMCGHGGEVEQVKQFLMKRNNAGELNIEKLCVVGVEMGASLAINWAALDWSWPQLSTMKQGQDVKALVLVSPEWTFKGLAINRAMQDPAVQSELSFLIIAGKNNAKSMEQAKRLHKQLERFHPLPPEDERKAKQDLFLDTPKNSLQGTKLLNEKTAKLDEHIAQFIQLRLVEQRYPWSERKNPLAN